MSFMKCLVFPALAMLNSASLTIPQSLYEELTSSTNSLPAIAEDITDTQFQLSSLPSSPVGSEYVAAYYRLNQNFDYRLETHTYYSSNLSPFYFTDHNYGVNGSGHLTSFAYNTLLSWISEGSSAYGSPYNGYLRNYKCDLYSDYTGGWAIAGLFRKTGAGTPILGETPSGSSPLYSVKKIITSGDTTTYIDVTSNASDYFSYRVAQLGDLDNDGQVGLQDAVIISHAVSGAYTFDTQQYLAADVNGDHLLNSSDTAMMLNYLAGNIDSFLENWTYYTISNV